MIYILIGLIAGVAGLIGFCYWAAQVAIKVKRRPKTKTPSEFGLGYEDVHFESQGHRLPGWVIRQPGHPEAPFVMLIHGWESNAQGMLPHAKYLFEAGFNLFLYDTRGHGDGPDMEQMTLIRFTEDAEAAYAFLRKKFKPRQLGIFGHSMGGATAIVLAGRHPEITALVSSSAFATFADMNRDMMRAQRVPYYPFAPIMEWFWNRQFKTNVHDWSPNRHLGRYPGPALLAFGGADEMFSQIHFDLLKAAAPDADTHFVPNGGHRNLFEDVQYRESVTNFLTRYLFEQKSERIAI